jgi:cell division transport system ATP-binding protein
MIQMFHVSKAYPGDPPALVDVNLMVEKGEFVFLTGPRCGKTTLLRLVFCAEPATRGRSGRGTERGPHSPGEHPLPSPQHRRRLPGLAAAHRTVLDNVALAMDVLGVPRDESRQRANRMLKLVGLQHKTESLPLKLSGGEQQRVVIARALVNEPALCSPTSPPATSTRTHPEIMSLLSDANVRGTTVVVATHDLAMVERLQKRVVRLDKGRIVSDGGPAVVRRVG